MGRRVRDVMTPEVVTVGEPASFKEIAATLAEHRRHHRPDATVTEAARLLHRDVLVRALDEPGHRDREVRDGIVTLSGQVERRSLIPITVPPRCAAGSSLLPQREQSAR
jgi:CBS-domain-containing membrane protein